VSITMTIEIPALDRLCAILERQDRGAVLEALKAEIVRQLEAAAKGGTLEKAAKGESPTTADAVPLPAAAGRQEKAAKGDQSPTTAETVTLPSRAREARAVPVAAAGRQEEEVKEAKKENGKEGGEVKDADVRKALNGLIKAGKRDAVKAILKSFSADNFSKLKPADYAAVLEKAKEAGTDD